MAAPHSPGRMIRRDISRSKGTASLSPKALALFCLLIPHFDSHGKLNGEPHFVKGEVCPLVSWLDIPSIKKCLREITDKTNVKWFEASDGCWYLHALHFEEHQDLRADRRGEDRLPSFPGIVGGSIPGEVLEKSGTTPGEVRPEVEVEVEVEGEGEAEGEEKNLSAPADLPALWNRICISLPKCLKITDKRKAHVKSRLKEYTLAEWEAIFQRIESSPFLRGENGGWKASFDWIVSSPDNAVKVLEGKYDRSNGNGSVKSEPRGLAAIRALREREGRA